MTRKNIKKRFLNEKRIINQYHKQDKNYKQETGTMNNRQEL